MSRFQALLPVVVCVVTAGKYPQQSQPNAYVFSLSDFTLTKDFYQPLSPAVYTCHTRGEGNIDLSHASRHEAVTHCQVRQTEANISFLLAFNQSATWINKMLT